MSTFPNYNQYGSTTTNVQKPKVFISYHHANDQQWYDDFAQNFGTTYDVFTDKSLERQVDSDDSEYVKRSIRENNIFGSSVTVVLCGQETWKRRWVDWEIQMTLNKQHAILGIILPCCARNYSNEYIVPDRLMDNINSGYASWITWPNDFTSLIQGISDAKDNAKNTSKIENSRLAMQRSKS